MAHFIFLFGSTLWARLLTRDVHETWFHLYFDMTVQFDICQFRSGMKTLDFLHQFLHSLQFKWSSKSRSRIFFFQLYKKFLETKSFAELKIHSHCFIFKLYFKFLPGRKCSFPFGFSWPGKNFFVNPRDVMELAQEKINLVGIHEWSGGNVQGLQSPSSSITAEPLQQLWAAQHPPLGQQQGKIPPFPKSPTLEPQRSVNVEYVHDDGPHVYTVSKVAWHLFLCGCIFLEKS